MARLLIVYGTVDGHTRRIAEFVAERARGYGHTPFVVDAAATPVLESGDRWTGVIVCAPLHAHQHPRQVTRFVRENLRVLQHLPGALFSVSLSATGSDVPGARKCADAFLARTGWHPAMVRLVAGALKYRRYGPVKRRIMQFIAWRNGGDTDVRHDYVYTDWDRLAEDVEDFLLEAVPAPAGMTPAVLVSV